MQTTVLRLSAGRHVPVYRGRFGPAEVERLLWRAGFGARGINHVRTRPHRPRTNGKVERFHQTMARESADGLVHRSHRHRNRALPHWLEHYNRRRPHSSLGDRPPISRVHNVCG